MNILLKIACQVIARRRANGETFEDIIKEYPRMTAEQVEEIKEALGIRDAPAPVVPEEQETETEATSNE
ncbi:DUF433 domain-containing protein [Faecalispora jeddahensis]|uniref:DUF433 domain-containing protein n=1 Tax=Faecalispora jeddahensis TaxID=1414721 RepID=UPI00145BF60A|nr:DUF433 domain-containing protein [Faecalispora jeddahensis]